MHMQAEPSGITRVLRYLMSYLDHPCIAKLYGTYKSKDSLMMLLEPCMGGELYSYMRDMDELPLAATLFYAGCITSAVDYMHQRSILYRDLKPENIVLASNGYAKVSDA